MASARLPEALLIGYQCLDLDEVERLGAVNSEVRTTEHVLDPTPYVGDVDPFVMTASSQSAPSVRWP